MRCIGRMSYMQTRKVTIAIPNGLDSKLAALLIQKASNYKSECRIEKEFKHANAKSLLGVLSFGLKEGEEVVLHTEGIDESEAMETLVEFLTSVKTAGEAHE